MALSLGKSVPYRHPSSVTRLILLLSLSVVLMVLDHRGNHLETIRATLSLVVYPVQIVAALPGKAIGWAAEAFRSGESIEAENRKLKQERRQLLARTQRMEALEAENRRLRELLHSASRAAERAVVADLLEVHPEPFSRTIVINKGKKDDVYVGQPIIDTRGVVGQITAVGALTSRGTLITDPSHATPVQVNRNGLRTILIGTGDQYFVDAPYLTASADIREGDLLVTSGMAGTFPAGYPVAVVTKIVNDPNEAFLQVRARVKAQLNHNKEVLLIWRDNAPAASSFDAEKRHEPQ